MTDLRLAFEVIITALLSVALGLVVAILSFRPSQPFPFSQCLEYPLNSPPGSCDPLAPILILLAACLLLLTAIMLIRKGKRVEPRERMITAERS